MIKYEKGKILEGDWYNISLKPTARPRLSAYTCTQSAWSEQWPGLEAEPGCAGCYLWQPIF